MHLFFKKLLEISLIFYLRYAGKRTYEHLLQKKISPVLQKKIAPWLATPLSDTT